MADPSTSSSLLNICSLSPEILTLILSNLPAKSVLNVSETCRHLRDVVFGCDVLWKRLCMNHFNFDLQVKGPFQSFACIYELIYKYRRVVWYQNTSYVPKFHFHWAVLLEEGTVKPTFTSRYETGFLLCSEFRLKKTWEITESDITQVAKDTRKSNKHVLIDLIKSKLGVNDRQQFQNAVLQRCIRNQKKIRQQFETASVVRRCDGFEAYITNHSAKTILMTKEPIPNYLDDFKVDHLFDADLETMPIDIVMDYLKGHFHKTGIEQVENYVEFVNTAKCCYKWNTNNVPHKIVDAICNAVYKKFKQTARLRLVSSLEYCQCAEEYFARIEEIEKWQEDIEQHLEVIYTSGNFTGVTEKDEYKNYVLEGKKEDFTSLKNHYEGLINIKIWLIRNMWIEEVLGSCIVSVLKGKSISSVFLAVHQHNEIAEFFKKYLQTNKEKHFRRLIQKLWLYATRKLERKADYLYKLQEDLNAKKVTPPYIKS